MKITKYFLSMAAAVGMFAGCQEPEMVQMAAPEDVVAPELEAVEGPIEITPSNMVDGVVAFTWSAADYGVQTQINYSLEAATAAAPDTKVTITSGMTGTSTEVDYETLNAILFNDLGLADGVAEDINFFIGAKVGEYAKIYSNAVTVSCKVTAAEKTYPTLTVAGSYAYNNWTPGKGQFVFDFDGTDTKYSGVIDFGEDVSALQFKFVGAKWGENEFSSPKDEAQAAEAAELPLVAGGGDNISAYTTHRFYSLTLDKATPKLIKNFSFNQIGVIGSFNDWGGDVVMNFNADKQRFYADVEFAADGQFKLRADADWALNWGAAAFGMTVSNGDGNLEAKAGNYRIYANMNNPAEMTIELNADMFGKEEPVGGNTTPEPEPDPTPVVGWSLIGAFNEWAGDLMLTSDGTYYVIKGAELEGELKFRKDGQWNYKDEEGNEVQTNLGAAEGVTFAADAELALAPNGGNINVTAGTYDVYLDPENAKAWFITDGSYPGGGAAPEASPWALIGEFNNWGADYPMFIEGEYHVAKGFVVAAAGGLKFRKDGMWNYKDETGAEIQTNLGGTFAVDAELDVVGNGSNLNVPAGTYDVYLKVAEDGQSGKAYFMTDGKTPADAGEAVVTYIDPSAEAFVVGFSGSAIGWDDPSFDQGDRASFVSKNVTDAATFAGTYEFKLEGLAVAANDELKARINEQWIGVGGATVEGLTVTGTDNFIAGEAGTYNVVITFAWDGLIHSDVKVVFSK